MLILLLTEKLRSLFVLHFWGRLNEKRLHDISYQGKLNLAGQVRQKLPVGVY